MLKPSIEKRCPLTDLPTEWCAHCRKKTLTDEEQDKKNWNNLFDRWARIAK